MNRPQLTIDDFINTYQHNTTLKATFLLRDRFDKHTTIDAQVDDVLPATRSLPNRVMVSLITAKNDGVKISAEFDTEKDATIKSRLLELERLDFIRVSGLISSTAKDVLNLMDCDFEKIEDYEF